MKKINLAIILLFSFFMNSCEEVVQVDLDTEAPRLVIEANLKWQKGTNGSQQKIKLSTTTSFFSDQIPTVSGAEIMVKNNSNVPFIFTEIANTGEYECNNFIPVIDERYTLTVKLNDIVYSATETLKPVAPIDEVTQNDEGGIAKDQIQIKTFFNDPVATNYYLFQYTYKEERFQNLSATDDSFFKATAF